MHTNQMDQQPTLSIDVLEQSFLSLWNALRELNPELSADGFAQASYAMARRGELECMRKALLKALDHALRG